ncbi:MULTISPECIES: hypothetical protein [unclassified Streptomyces]|uniref:hypothetical protein n=1 Tax=unclassified Streptomyces TaxID=2593676 RepID=UPI001BE7AE34|nr:MULTISPECIES: hypothetical protein [unclassified Streptomyces]MBT2402370.1 hypothetical protein [Streptomyces sp. ISL-21]MBT2456899.1 hypothetical protein [Streptomyces sp. ISL-86]MBT2607702.1 hypothetical protein [Streptomyces sp. ISL-87]
MTEIPIPHQPAAAGGGGGNGPRDGRPPVHPSVSEAGRFLCAGTYLDAEYRDQVIDELYVHEERIVAPSYGFDASRVLAHALRARRVELGWAAGVLGAWFVGSLLTGGALAALLFPFLLLSLADWLRARGIPLLRFLSVLLRVYVWVALLGIVLFLFGLALTGAGGPGGLLALLFGGQSFGSSSSLGGGPFEDSGASLALWWPPIVFAGVVTVVGLQRGHVARTIATDLSPERYADPSADPAEAHPGVRLARVRKRIRSEQHAPMIMYDINNPFAGAGEPYRPWQLSVELRPRADLGPGVTPRHVTNAHIAERIVPLLERLRVPSPHGSPQAEAAVLDRMRELVVDECVFLPAGGLPHRDAAPVAPQQFAEHRAAAIEEGGERRRHFLRVRVGGWDENMVVTVFVRVHTQGGMMMLEVAPHVLLPARIAFHNADADAERYLNNNRFGKAVWAVRHTPGSFVASLATLGRGFASWWRIATGGHGGARPEGPRLSVRELGSQNQGSLFHLMDLDRYLKTIQDRVVGGVTMTLHEAGWHTEEFAQRAVHVAEGGVYIQSVHDSAFSVGGTGHHNSTHRGSGSGR